MKYLQVLFLLVLLFPAEFLVNGQESKASVSLGVGFAETLNAGFRYQVSPHSRLGLSIGTWPSGDDWLMDWDFLLSISGDYYYHFGNPSKLTALPPWYLRMGPDYFRIAWDSDVENNLEVHLRFGRDFNFTELGGISLDLGMALFLVNETGFTSFLPALGMGLFYRF